MGAKVIGYSLEAPTKPSFFEETNLRDKINDSTISDIRDLTTLTTAIKQAQPSVIIHMAAQSLVRESYNSPVDTFTSNVIGTVNTLEAARQTDSVQAILNITTDKCYENLEWIWPYRENDRLGGNDPYSSSKACAEIVANAYRNSFYKNTHIQLASARAGNVIGGGDWANDRLIPDFLRAADTGKALCIRSPNAVRPWQHILEPISGYLMLIERLIVDKAKFAEAWNFGPNESETKSVSWIVNYLYKKNLITNWELRNAQQAHEANYLKLDSTKAKTKLEWSPKWSLETALNKTLEWHKAWKENQAMAEFSLQQIETYQDS